MKYYHYINNTNGYKTSKGFGGVTLAYKYEDNKIIFSVAQCSIKDRYIRTKGRDVATQKMLNGEVLKIATKREHRKALKRFEEGAEFLCISIFDLIIPRYSD